MQALCLARPAYHVFIATARPEVPLYKERHKIEDSFGWLKDWHRIATRYDQYAHTFFSSISVAASLTFYVEACTARSIQNFPG